jgi:hypothetical protein
VKIRMQEVARSGELTCNGWNVGVVGKQIDDRGRAACGFIEEAADQLIFVDYDAEKFTLRVGDRLVNAEEVEDYFVSLTGESVIFESTTLGFVELFLCCRALYNLGFPKISILYVEPQRYSRRASSGRRSLILNKRDFVLSDDVPGYRAIPGATRMLRDGVSQRSVFFLGYEERRLESALEGYQMLQPSSCSVVFGVPAFQPGWEMDAFANNIRVIRERNISGGVYFCGAENPAAAVQVLETIYSELGERERLFIAPIGTKPNGVGVALFAATHPNVGLLYDHPQRRRGRSEAVSKWHLFDVEF